MSTYGHERQMPSAGRSALLIAFGLTMAMMCVEFIVGSLAGSLALLADAGHMLTDAGALALSLFAAWVCARPATLRKTYGYYRTEVLAALANGIVLWLIVIWIYVRAIDRLRHPLDVASAAMMVVAALGLGVNLGCGWLLRHERRSNLNIQGAWLNVMSDALGSLGVLAAGAMISWRGWTVADPIVSMFIGLLIAGNSWTLVQQAVNVLLEGTPAHLEVPEVVQAIEAIPGIVEVHDVHLWTITPGMDAMSGHVMVADLAHSETILSQLNALLQQRFGISHTTFQLEPQHRG